ncbi:MAG: DUF389 domain-containing protein [Acidimicrobiales bacterium]|nr:DUF389 domain-containing protein [Acidimicrobiales bacterium]MCB9392521.1 DUF389 domain-containing protein [Acidimicrobiaceae bacterium]
MVDAPVSSLLGRGRSRGRMSPEQRAVVTDFLYSRARVGSPHLRNFIVLSVLSSAIAAMGLLLDSAAAVIGAMLLGPFITPLLAVAGALIQGWTTRLGDAALVLALGMALSITSALVTGRLFASELDRTVLPAQLLSLTRPGLLDLGIALAAGLAAGYATMRTEAAGALSGVAVSVTVEPPLAAIGLFVASGRSDDVQRAGLALVTNFGALVLGATAAMAFWGFGDRGTRGPTRQARLGLAAWVLLMAAVTVPLAFYSRDVVRNTAFEQQVSRTVTEWDPSVRVVSVDAETDGERAEVRIDVTGPRRPEPAWKLAELLSSRRGERVEVSLTFTLTQEDRAVSTD